MHYNYFRYYDPGTGRYITSDPIGITKSLFDPQMELSFKLGVPIYPGADSGLNHLYVYASQNPLYYTDPYGLWGASVFGCVGLHCVSGNSGGAEHQWGPPALGGGITVCSDDPDDEGCDKNDPDRNKGEKGGTYGKFGIGVTVWEDGKTCISIGPHVGLPGPVINGGDATVHN